MKLEVVILAAGQGTRMKSRLPKVLHTVGGKPLLEHVIRTAQALDPFAIHVVIGHGSEQVQQALSRFKLNWVTQTQQLGTGHAVMQALPAIASDSVVLVLYGDVPLTQLSTLQDLVRRAQTGTALLTATLQNPQGYGRILRDGTGALLAVVEDKDATVSQRQIREINTGVLAAPHRDLQEYLPQVENKNQQAEYYLPDIISLAVARGKTVKIIGGRNRPIHVLRGKPRRLGNGIRRGHRKSCGQKQRTEHSAITRAKDKAGLIHARELTQIAPR